MHTFFTIFVEAGHIILVNREIGKYPDNSSAIVGRFLVIKALTFGVVFLTMLAGGYLLDFSGQQMVALALLGAGLFSQNVLALFYGVFRSVNKMKLEGMFRIIEPIFYLVLLYSITFVFDGLTILLVSLAFMSSSLVIASSAYVSARNYIGRYSFSLSIDDMMHFLKESAPFIFSTLLFGLLSRVNFFLLKDAASSSDLGYYGLAFRITINLTVVGGIVTGGWISQLSHSYLTDRSRFSACTKQLLLALFVVDFGLCGSAIAISPWIIPLLFGGEYTGAVPIAQILALGSFLFILAMHFQAIFDSTGHQRLWTLSILSGLVFNMILSVILIPAHGTYGAAASYSLSCGVVCVTSLILYLAFRKKIF